MNIAIAGYGNLGKGVEAAVLGASDMTLHAIFTRRSPQSLKTQSSCPVFSIDELSQHADDIDVLIICGGSATDLPSQTPEFARCVNVVDSFDTHAHIPEHFAAVDEAAKEANTLAVISCGWDPGLFSLARVYANAVLPEGSDYTFWGRGVSQGHSDAIRHIPGVIDARQYTVPVEAVLEQVRSGEQPELTTREKHLRECYVVADEGADLEAIEQAIVTMPNYFADYDTSVNFISAEELEREHQGLPHGGTVIRSGTTGVASEYKNTIEFSLKLDSNPYFTGSVLVAAARACHRMAQEGKSGAITMLDIPPAKLSACSADELRAQLL